MTQIKSQWTTGKHIKLRITQTLATRMTQIKSQLTATKSQQNVWMKNNRIFKIVSLVSLTIFLTIYQQLGSRMLLSERRLDEAIFERPMVTSISTVKSFPTLESLVNNEEIVGDVQFLLDFAILGFGKCGTTSLLRTLREHTFVETLGIEANYLSKDDPVSLVRDLHALVSNTTEKKDNRRERLRKKDRYDQKVLYGIKNPGDIRREQSLMYIQQYWPRTKIIVMVRHPMDWFRSLYNFVLNEMGKSEELALKKIRRKKKWIVDTYKGKFHLFLSKMGKTSMGPTELRLLGGDDGESLLQGIDDESLNLKMPNKVFLVEMNELRADQDSSDELLFRSEFSKFLGLYPIINHTLHIRPGNHKKAALQKRVDIDLCKEEFVSTRRELMTIAQQASRWLRLYFLQSDDVKVASKARTEKLLLEWMHDPCNSINNINGRNNNTLTE